MERYCYKVYKRDDFLPECNFKYWKIDIRRVMCEVYNTDNDSEKSNTIFLMKQMKIKI